MDQDDLFDKIMEANDRVRSLVLGYLLSSMIEDSNADFWGTLEEAYGIYQSCG